MPDRIRVLHVMFTTRRGGGIQRVVLDIVTGSDARRFQHFVCTLRRERPEHNLDVLNYLPTTAVTDLRKRDQQRLLAREIAAHIRRHRIDILQCHLIKHARYLTVRARLAGARVIRTIHCTVEGRSTRTGIFARAYNRMVAQYTAVSRDLVEGLGTAWCVPASCVLVIPNGIDLDHFSNPSVERKTMRRSLGIGEDELLVLSIGRLTELKDIPTVLKALASARSSIGKVKFLIAGDGPARANLETQARDIRLEGIVQFLGYREDIPDLLAAADILVMASIREGFGIAAAEAMAAGCPVIGTDVPGLRFVLDEGKAGMLIPAHSPDRLAEAMISLASNDCLRKEMAEKGRTRARNTFPNSGMIEKYQRLYECVIHESRRSTRNV